ncbi:MAG: hypothetical protein IJ251_04105 [Oscillospiraceae bacterium]|nr:hypothetical protein [Oscillospiraceae bacterium]
MKDRPIVRPATGGVCWEHTFDTFRLKVYVPDNDLNGRVNDYCFRAPLLTVFEEREQDMDSAVRFARESGLAACAARADSSVLFVYPVNERGWAGADISLYREYIANVKMIPVYEDGIVADDNFFTGRFEGYFIRGAKFRTDIYSFGASADYTAKYLLDTVEGEYLWGPGEITPAVCSMERLGIVPDVKRKDIAVISVGNSDEINAAFEGSSDVLIKDKADYEADFMNFVRRYKMWCGKMETEPDLDALGMTEEAGAVTVKTSPDNRNISAAERPAHDVGYFAYYNKGLFDKGAVPLVIGLHGGGDSSLFFTFVTGWWQIAHDNGFLFVSLDDHLSVTATEIIEVIEHLKQRYPIDTHRIYATGFSMGSGKTWDLFQQYPEVFAGVMPASALFPVYTTFYGEPVPESSLNRDVPLPVFYSGGEDSHLPELPFQNETCLERAVYAAGVNRVKARFDSLRFADRDSWDDRIWGIKGDRVEKLYDPDRDSTLTVNYYDSEDGICRTAFASVSGQVHEFRLHSARAAWDFISKFTR